MTFRLYHECMGCARPSCTIPNRCNHLLQSSEEEVKAFENKFNAEFSRIDLIAQNGNTGLHYEEDVEEENVGNGGSTPGQYGLPPDATDLQDLIEYRKMDFATGNIFKACYRLGTKNDDLYEINKILWFAERKKAEILKGIKNE